MGLGACLMLHYALITDILLCGVCQGDRGSAGERGLKGIKGELGDPGTSGQPVSHVTDTFIGSFNVTGKS